MKIACDVGVSNRSIKFLKSRGFDVVLKAGPGQPDKEWFDQSIELGANVFVSADWDLAKLVEAQHDRRIWWVKYDNQPYNAGQANQWLFNRLMQLKEVWGL